MEQLVGTVPGKTMLAVLFSAWPSALGIKTCWCGVGGGETMLAIVDAAAVVILVIRCGRQRQRLGPWCWQSRHC